MIFFIQIPTYQPTLSITKWLITKWPHERSHTKCPPRSGPHDIVLHEVTASRTPLVSAYYFEILMSKEKSIRNVRFKLDFKFEVSKSKNISESFVYVICLFIISIISLLFPLHSLTAYPIFLIHVLTARHIALNVLITAQA